MKKKILIAAAVVIMLGAAYVLYLNYQNYRLSPRGKAELTSGNLSVAVSYCRPSVRGRLVFGEAAQGALQPYGQYWRLGANESTEITFSRDVLFNDQPVKKGTYRMYAVPGKDEFEISLNTELGRWGAFEPDYSKDILKTKVARSNTQNPVEQYTITLKEMGADPNEMNLIFEWSDTRFSVPIKGQ